MSYAERLTKPERREVMGAFTTSYLHCALWFVDENPGSGEWQPHHLYTVANIDQPALDRAVYDCRAFQDAHAADLATAGLSDERAGCDFYFDRNGHGTGFLTESGVSSSLEVDAALQRLHQAARVYGGFDLYLGDDSRIYDV